MLMCIGPVMRWKADDPDRVRKAVQVPFAIALAAGLILPFIVDGVFNIATGLGLAAAIWIATTSMTSRTRPEIRA